LEGICLLLHELIVESLKSGLLRLLFDLTSAKLRLRTGKASLLRTRAELAKLRASLTEAGEVSLLRREADALLLLGGGYSLVISLLENRSHSLRRAKRLLAGKFCRHEARAVPAKRASRLRVDQV
jgi:hypothetical protein